jgi:hypothetical protein
MIKLDYLSYLIIFFIIIISVKIYYESDIFHLKCIISDVNNKTYCVRESKYMDATADLLANVADRLDKLVVHLSKKYKNDETVNRLKKNFSSTKIKETLPTSKYTAYSENKGEKIAFCVKRTKGDGNLIDLNTLMFVAIHEMGHIATKEVGHTETFWKNFKFLLKESVEIGIYNPVDYSEKPVSYCSMKLNDNPLFDD